MARGRKQGAHIKDLRYEKYFIITYKQNHTYIYCYPSNETEPVFIPLELVSAHDLELLNIFKYKTEKQAEMVIDSLPVVELNGDEMWLEVTHNTMIADLL